MVSKFTSFRFQSAVFLCLSVVAAGGAPVATSTEQSYLHENASAMGRMMQLMTVRPSGDIDADFVNIMEPHHQGAIDMAQLELRYGRNEQLRRIAQEIIVDQQQEIVAMHFALGRPLPAMKPAPNEAVPRDADSGMLHH